jgi:hypothetical protein
LLRVGALVVPIGPPHVFGSVLVVEPKSLIDTVERAPQGQVKCHTRRNPAGPREMGVSSAGANEGASGA